MPPNGDLAHNPGMGPDWESNRQPFGLQAGTQSTEPQHPGLIYLTICFKITIYRKKKQVKTNSLDLKRQYNILPSKRELKSFK